MALNDFKYFTLAPYAKQEYGQYVFDGGIVIQGDAASLGGVHLEYRLVYDVDDEENGAGDWLSYAVGQTISLSRDDWFGIQFRNSTGSFSNNPNTGDNYYHVRSTLEYVAGGRLMSLVDYTDEQAPIPVGAFYRLFNETLIYDASELILPDYVSDYCYTGMFFGCAQLRKAPELPAEELAASCYFYMFKRCSALTKVVLPATSGYASSYAQMFSECTGIKEIVFGYPQWPAQPNTGIDWMLDSAPANGVFYYTNTSFDYTAVPRSGSGVPSNWQIAYFDTTPYFRITSLENNNTVALNKYGSPAGLSMQYRTDLNLEWQMYTVGTQLTLFKDSWIEFRNTSGRFSTGRSSYYKFSATGMFNVSGNIGSLIYYSLDKITAQVNYAFVNLFNGCATLIDASGLKINMQSVGTDGFYMTFRDCTYMTKAPAIPNIRLSDWCCQYMFQNCRSLIHMAGLYPATLATGCYHSMFQNCSSLVEAPEMHATQMATACCAVMFGGCSQLRKAPALPATQLARECYDSMFLNCTSLVEAPDLPATRLYDVCYGSMFSGCSSLTKAPELRATTLASTCYGNMFNGCGSLSELKYSSDVFPTTSQASSWLNAVQSEGVFYYTDENLNVGAISRSSSGIPAGWTIQYMPPRPSVVLSINNRAVKSLTINGKTVAKLG